MASTEWEQERKKEGKEIAGTPPGAGHAEATPGEAKKGPGETMQPLSDRDKTPRE